MCAGWDVCREVALPGAPPPANRGALPTLEATGGVLLWIVA